MKAGLDMLPHQPPMRLVEAVLELVPGERAQCQRITRADDWFFQGHFPGHPVVPAVVLVELLAQTGGFTVGTGATVSERPLQLRVAALGPFKFPAAAGVGVTLNASARLTARVGSLYKVEGEVTADGVVVAAGSVTLAAAP